MSSKWAAAAVLALAAGCGPAQQGASPAAQAEASGGGPRGSTWASIAAQPDFSSGVWMQQMDLGASMNANSVPHLTPAYQAKVDAARKSATPESVGGNDCAPRGVPAIMRMPYPKKFLFEPRAAYIFIEAFMQTRFIHMDGRRHPPPEDLLLNYNGHSIGHWDGDTLVIDTVGFVDTTPLTNVGSNMLPILAGHSEKMHVVERLRLLAPDLMELQMTVEDPEALVEPWVYTMQMKRLQQDLEEYYCANPLDLNSIK
jgi:hypothetical protein